MSMPKFPEVDPEITCDSALNMILSSIAMEELALSHIINAEGEKIQYVLKALEESSGVALGIDEVLKVNDSVTRLLNSASQYQTILSGKMDRALYALSDICPGREDPSTMGLQGPPGPQGLQGPQGPQGQKGEQGITGPKGERGLAGTQGAQGATGPQGERGLAGTQGPQGVAGPQGKQGATGPQGTQGMAGPQGKQGVAGPQGPQGKQGATGPKGEQGATGAKGEQGPRGDTGPAGQCTCCDKSSAALKICGKCNLWRYEAELPWELEHMYGNGICFDPRDQLKIGLCGKGRYVVNLIVNAKVESCRSHAAISLLKVNSNCRTVMCSVHGYAPCDGATVTMSMSGVIIENSNGPSNLFFRLKSSDSLMLKGSMLSIMEL